MAKARDTIREAINQTDTLDDAAHRWALWMADQARKRRALTAKDCVAYLARLGIHTTTNALRNFGTRKRIWCDTVPRFNASARRRMKLRIYDPKELVVFFHTIRRRTVKPRSGD